MWFRIISRSTRCLWTHKMIRVYASTKLCVMFSYTSFEELFCSLQFFSRLLSLFYFIKSFSSNFELIIAAARVVTNTRKYDRGLHHTMRHDLHWLDMTDRIQFRIAVTVYHCLHGTAPEYLSELFVPASTWSSRHCLRSSDSNKLVVPPVKLST